MKPLLFTLFLIITLQGFSQKHPHGKKIKALKIAYFTETLDLNEKEAQRFWPIFNSFNNTEKALKKDLRSTHNKIDVVQTDSEAKIILNTIMHLEEKKQDLVKKYIADLLNVLPAKKVLLALTAEHDFRRKMVEQFKKHHRFKKGKAPN